MVIMLPSEPDGLPELENQLSAKQLDAWLSRIPEKEVKVYMPKFRITWGAFELKEPLKVLGIRKAFGLMADFSGMDGTKKLFIDRVLHKAFVEVNEEGTEAAAATAVVMLRSVAVPKIHTFRADHPFVFLIRDNTTGSILFLGRVVDPSAEEN